MSIFKKRLPKKTKIQIALLSFVILAFCAWLIWDVTTKGPLTSLLSDREKLTNLVKNAGIFGPLLYIVLQITQTIAAPIPGQFVGAIGGLLFGWWGILWTVIGSAIGFFIVFTLARKFGRPLIEKLVRKEHLDKFDFIAGKKAPLILFSIFVLPGFPDDIVCYVAGFTEIPIKQLMAMIVVGRLPAVVVTNIFGDSLGHQNFAVVAGVIIASVVMIALAAIFNKKIIAFFQKLSKEDQKEVKNGN